MLDTLNPQSPHDRNIPRDHSKPMSREELREYSGLNKPKKRDTTKTNGLTEAIRDYIKLKGGAAFRINTTGIYSQSKQMYIHSGSTNGVPDIVGLLRGRFIGIEVKMGKDSMRMQQLRRKEEIEKAGGAYFIAKDFDSTKIFIDGL